MRSKKVASTITQLLLVAESAHIAELCRTSLHRGEGRINFHNNKTFWPVIDDSLRAAAMERGVRVRILGSHWTHTRPDMKYYLRSLQDLTSIATKMDIEAKQLLQEKSEEHKQQLQEQREEQKQQLQQLQEEIDKKIQEWDEALQAMCNRWNNAFHDVQVKVGEKLKQHKQKVSGEITEVREELIVVNSELQKVRSRMEALENCLTAGYQPII
ncbi:Phospholipase D3-like [Homarus americanus]|uniref:Phospholipase D3-like n=1 Tax=Homarus americanus TaxID=6706 RepID=A0A8J5MX52_HOMAM|nr:Phospholipase D3-like [Homarus americanus]